MFAGGTFAGYSGSISKTVIPQADIGKLEYKDVILDEIYVTKNILLGFNWQVSNEWDFDTYLHATFENSLHGGNVEFNKTTISAIKIKKRFVGDLQYKTIYERRIDPMDESPDFSIEFYDFLEPSNKSIEYAYVYVTSEDGKERYSATSIIDSKFDSYFICSPDGTIYPMIANVDNNVTLNRKTNLIESPGRKYPYVVRNGITKYYSGNLTVSFFEMDDNCKINTDNLWEFRREIDEFLSNGEPKLLKSFDGEIWMVDVVNNIARENSGHPSMVNHKIEWVEIGDPLSTGDLYDNGFINTDVDREN